MEDLPNITTSKEMPICSIDDMNMIIGKLLTIVDATIVDTEQKKATKSLVMQILWNWYGNLRGYSTIFNENERENLKDKLRPEIR